MSEGSRVPKKYEVAFLCDCLNLSLVELEAQPDWWVAEMMEYYEQKGLAEKHKAKIEDNRLKAQKNKG